MFQNMVNTNFGDNKYVIGFTEIQYLPQNNENTCISPTPSEHTIGYTSLALDYAERSNRGELSKFLGHSDILDKKKRDSVHKIHKSILDLMFEQTERRKIGTPIMSKSAMEFQRPDSVLSHASDNSVRTSSSFPLIEVQQLPPLAQKGFQRVSPCKDMQFGLPEIHELNWNDKTRVRHKSQHSEKKLIPNTNSEEVLMAKEQITNKSKQSGKETGASKFAEQTSKVSEKERSKHVKTPNFARKISTVNESKGSNSETTRKSISRGNQSVNLDNDQNQNQSVEVDSKTLPSSPDILVKPSDAKMFRNKPRSSSKRKISFCQSSYEERAERERMNNIRRRHASQTKLGPLDFNKLRHQLVVTRSYTMFN